MLVFKPIELITPGAVALGIEPPTVIIAPNITSGAVWTGKLIANTGTGPFLTQFHGEFGFPVERDGTSINAEYVPGVTNAISFACIPWEGLVVVKADGTLWSCGENWSGLLGLGISSTSYIQYGLAQIGSDTDWRWVSTGTTNNMGDGQVWALKTNGDLYWWGQDATNYPNNMNSPTLLATGMQNLVRLAHDADGFVIYQLRSANISTFKYGSLGGWGPTNWPSNFPWSGLDPDTDSFSQNTLYDFTPSGISNVKYFYCDGWRTWSALLEDGSIRVDDSWGAYQNNTAYPTDHTATLATNVIDANSITWQLGYLAIDKSYMHSRIPGYEPIKQLDIGPFEAIYKMDQNDTYLMRNDGVLFYYDAYSTILPQEINLLGKTVVEVYGIDSGEMIVAAEGTFVNMPAGTPLPYIVYDTFTDDNGTYLKDHIGEIGAIWTRLTYSDSFYADVYWVDTNHIQWDTIGGNLNAYMASGIPPTADYYVQCTVTIPASFTDDYTFMALIARTYETGLGYGYHPPGYYLELGYNSSSGWHLSLWGYKSNGVDQVGTAYPWTTDNYTLGFISSGTYTIKLKVVGSTIEGYIDGVLRVNFTNSDITAKGFAGMEQWYGDLLTIDNFQVVAI